IGSGYPALGEAAAFTSESVPTITFVGQLVGIIVFVAIGFITGFVTSLILKTLGMLRVPEAAEIAGLDTVKVPAQAYPEGIGASPPASQ
ncbi:MAG: ammonium transporter, partial [Pseudomonadota bacterium]